MKTMTHLKAIKDINEWTYIYGMENFILFRRQYYPK